MPLLSWLAWLLLLWLSVLSYLSRVTQKWAAILEQDLSVGCAQWTHPTCSTPEHGAGLACSVRCLPLGVLHLGRCVPFGHLQRCAEGNVQVQGVLGLRGCLWQGLEQLDPGSHVADGFQMDRK